MSTKKMNSSINKSSSDSQWTRKTPRYPPSTPLPMNNRWDNSSNASPASARPAFAAASSRPAFATASSRPAYATASSRPDSFAAASSRPASASYYASAASADSAVSVSSVSAEVATAAANIVREKYNPVDKANITVNTTITVTPSDTSESSETLGNTIISHATVEMTAPQQTAPQHVVKYNSAVHTPFVSTDNNSVIFDATDIDKLYLYPYIEYYQFQLYDPKNLDPVNTKIQTILRQSGPDVWGIPMGSTFTRYKNVHKRLVENCKGSPDYNDLYVCGIAYKDINIRSHISDIQLTITGDVETGMTYTETAKKEMAEEIGLFVVDLHKITTVPVDTYNILCIVNANNCTTDNPPSPSAASAASAATAPSASSAAWTDTKQRAYTRKTPKKPKVIVAVVGKLDELVPLLSTHRTRLTEKNELDLNNIDGVILTKLTDIEHMYK